MMILRSFPEGFGCPSLSPFCVKAMHLLTASGVDWTVDFQSDPRKAPKGKFPVLVDGDVIVADTWAIRAHLMDRTGVDLDAGLSVRERAHGTALARLTEDHLYFALVHDRWMNEANWPTVRDTYFSEVPRVIRGMVTRAIRKSVRRDLDGHGLGRFNVEEFAARVTADLTAIRDAISGDFLFGDNPTHADFAVAPVLQALAASPGESRVKSMVRDDPVLMTYSEAVAALLRTAPTDRQLAA